MTQKILEKELKLKRWRDKVKQSKRGYSHITKRRFYQQIGGEGTETNQQLETKKKKNSFGEGKNTTEKLNEFITWKKK